MARIVFGTYMVRYPLGGALSSALQWVLGLQALGHDVYVVEKSGWRWSCFDPVRGEMGDEFAPGFRVVDQLLRRFGLGGRLCYVDASGDYHGLSRRAVEDVIRTADLFIDRGAHGTWQDEAAGAGTTLLVDPDPGWRQIQMSEQLARGEPLPEYDHYVTVGLNIGTARSPAPTAARAWKHMLPPVATQQFATAPAGAGAKVTTVMAWKAHHEVEYNGRLYGQKDAEFERFLELPRRVGVPLEVAIGGAAPRERLSAHGWSVRDGHLVTATYQSYWQYVRASLAEFSVCKNVFVSLNTGWFSDRTAAYLACGRPAVVQDTGFSEHVPCGEGLFAVDDLDGAAAAIEAIESAYDEHCRAARELACERFDARIVLGQLLEELGVG
jgi:hypothetical protein